MVVVLGLGFILNLNNIIWSRELNEDPKINFDFFA